MNPASPAAEKSKDNILTCHKKKGSPEGTEKTL